VIAALACGGAAGAGLLLTARGLTPTRPSLARALDTLRRPPTPPAGTAANRARDAARAGSRDGSRDGGRAARLSQPLADRLTARLPGVVRPATRGDLTVLGRTPARHVAEKITLTLVGLLLLPALTAVLAAAGLTLPLALPVWGALACAAAGWLVPDLGVHHDAAARRRELRHALGAFLDLVVISLAGGGGVETALTDAASVGGGWAFDHLRRALATARLAGTTPWAALAALGTDLGVTDLVELAATVGLAGAEGAKVRSSLAAKAASLRAHELSDADATAQATTERMSLPVVLLFAGFLLFIGYPAIVRVLTGL
jgi:tight adherence protein C